MDLIDYIYDECQRQHVTNYGDFAKAHDLATSKMWYYELSTPEELGRFVGLLAKKVEPDVNAYRPGTGGNLRTSHVGFMHGGTAAPAGEVRERFDRWCGLAYELVSMQPLIGPDIYSEDVDRIIKSLLDIHPWADANGRTASILRNWMLNKLDDPEPLPYYYGNA